MADEMTPERVYCYQCQSVWAREEESALRCPICESEFVEIVERDNPPPELQNPPTHSPSPIRQSPSSAPSFHHIRGPRPGIQTEHLDAPGGRATFRSFRSGDGRFTFASTSFRSSRGGSPHGQPLHDTPVHDPFAFLRNTTALIDALTENPAVRPTRRHRSPGLQPLVYLPGVHEPQGDDLGLNIDGDGNTLRVSWRLAPRNAYNAREDTDPFAHLQEVLGQFAGYQRGNQMNGGANEDADIRSLMLSLLQGIAEDGGSLDENADRPVTREQLALLKTQTLKETLQETEGALDRFDGTETCGICMETVGLDSRVTVLPCKHWFHSTCISPWLDDHNTCPHCRARIGRPTLQTPNRGHQQNSTTGSGAGSRSPPQSASGSRGRGSMADPFIVSDSPPRRSNSGNVNPSQSPRSSTNRDRANPTFNGTENLPSRPRDGGETHTNPAGWLWNWLHNSND
ncbi:hypothetical protein HCBG_06137 [Histoplasma capsulatum G186AR]|uniref:RING-type E3 ubiquitin transferase n=2 Tax=Ajellomyces capsulatus TaxID=5037 RepID=C0NSK7_AJECG|nr:uncharacterized protein HCBG_06137 [Histoplasma capsulatum G186AR]EEH05873.1 hypothetical protein HCBG_06137 [Histoplasma capsulatum G186AR]KAG5299959.1 RING finger domain-containing protein [Histoplasma capsulatum]QSS67412.1 RING finger domain-containing protein [Histoplasma capsulatum G186AR]